jgi:hypothetical protein
LKIEGLHSSIIIININIITYWQTITSTANFRGVISIVNKVRQPPKVVRELPQLESRE